MKKGTKRTRDRANKGNGNQPKGKPEEKSEQPGGKTTVGTERQPWTWEQVSCLLLIALAGVYVAIRAARLELADHEARLWQNSLKPGLEAMLTLEHLDPENHFLQGILSLPFLHLWPGNPVTGMRIPGVLSFFVFAWAGWRLGRRLKRNWLRVLLLMGWFGNAVLLEGFSQVQGCGLMVAFSSLACLGLLEAYDRRGAVARRQLWSGISILAAAAAMLSIMEFAAGFCVIAGLLIVRCGLDAQMAPDTAAAQDGRGRWRRRLAAAWEQSGFIFATSLAVGVFYLPRYLILQDLPAMHGGGDTGFIHDTMSSVVDTFPHFLPNAATPYLPMLAYGVTGLMALNAAAVGICLVRRGKWREKRAFLESPTILLAVLFAGIWALSCGAHAVADAPYLVQRSTLFLWPLVVAQCVFAMDETGGIWKWVIRGLNLAALAAALLVAGRSLNLDHGEANEPMAHQSAIAREIAKLAQEAHGRPVVVGMTDPMKDTFGHYMEEVGGLKESPQTERNPVFKMFGGNLYIYSLNYELPEDAEWHWHPATTHYLLSEFYGHHPDAALMNANPVAYWQEMRAGLYQALPQEKARGCKPGTCEICRYFREMTSYRETSP